ncbi:MAG TPA: DUF6285 domain-containing protein [Acidimicrobiales bacterium]|nr:DUF6285 domain-containing protein [Acidimicrobiales bacterium]
MTEPSSPGLHDIPDAAGLVEAVREFLEHDVMAATEGRIQFHTRVAVNVLGMVERELEKGAAQLAAHRAGLEALGLDDERSLAEAIRNGALDDRLDEVRAFVESTVRAKLEVANPRYLEGPRPPVA